MNFSNIACYDRCLCAKKKKTQLKIKVETISCQDKTEIDDRNNGEKLKIALRWANMFLSNLIFIFARKKNEFRVYLVCVRFLLFALLFVSLFSNSPALIVQILTSSSRVWVLIR